MNKILAIDDNLDILFTIKEIVKVYLPQSVFYQASSGKEGIIIAENENVDVIILDIRMPDINGYEVCKILKDNNKTKQIPVIMLTAAEKNSSGLVKGLDCGADSYLHKPIENEELVAQIKVALRIKNAEDRLRIQNGVLEKEIVKTKNLYEDLFNNISDSIIIYDLEGNILEVNKRTIDLYGFTYKELLSMNIKDISLKLIDIKEDIFEKLIHQKSIIFESEIKNKNNKTLQIEVNLQLYEFKDMLAILSVNRDISERKSSEKKIIDSEEKYRNLFETMIQGVVYHDRNGVIISVNTAAEKIIGLAKGQMIGKTCGDAGWKMIHSDGSEYLCGEYPAIKALETGLVQNNLIGLLNLEYNQYRWIIVNSVPRFKTGEDKPYEVFSTFEDITERNLIEDALRKQFRLNQILLDSMPYACILIEKFSRSVVAFNKAAENMGVKFGSTCYESISDFNKPCWWCKADDLWATNQAQKLEIDEKGLIWEIYWFPIDQNLYMHFFIDITERKIADTKINNSLKEKEVMLHEIHHRVKNNMQVISSIISLQLFRENDENTINILNDSINRIKAMALVHDRLYKENDFSNIDFYNYITSYVFEIQSVYQDMTKEVKIEINVDNINLSLDKAIPCALILNELITNSYKYAFKNKNEGVIIITLIKKDDKYRLTISDNGVGLPNNFNLNKPKTLGIEIVVSLVKQLNGTISVGKTNGASFIIEFNSN